MLQILYYEKHQRRKEIVTVFQISLQKEIELTSILADNEVDVGAKLEE